MNYVCGVSTFTRQMRGLINTEQLKALKEHLGTDAQAGVRVEYLEERFPVREVQVSDDAWVTYFDLTPQNSVILLTARPRSVATERPVDWFDSINEAYLGTFWA